MLTFVLYIINFKVHLIVYMYFPAIYRTES